MDPVSVGFINSSGTPWISCPCSTSFCCLCRVNMGKGDHLSAMSS